MKRVLLSEALCRFKTNLHCHSSLSDGALSPEELKRRYAAHGYSVLAITDHNLFLPHNDLTDSSFLALNGVEMDFGHTFDPVPKVCHLGFIALEKDTLFSPGSGSGEHLWGAAARHREKMAFDPAEPHYERIYSPEGVNALMAEGKRRGFFVIYNHPLWSLEDYPEYSAYEGMDAVEIFKYDAYIAGYPDKDLRVYEDLLNLGRRIYCTANDDNHNHRPESDPLYDSYGGYNTVFAEKLEYRAVTRALQEGRFTCSKGNGKQDAPEILDLSWEDGTVAVKCRGALYASLQTDVRIARQEIFDPASEGEACFAVPEEAKWFRVTLKDEKGFQTFSRAYFTDELK